MSPVSHNELVLSILDHKTYDKISSFISNNNDTVLGLVGYTSSLTAEVIKTFPDLIFLMRKLLFRLRLISKVPQKTNLSDRQLHLIKTLKAIYGYIADVRVFNNIFGILSYISTFLKDYSTPSKLKRNVDSLESLNKFTIFVLFTVYQVYENLGFLASHDFLPSSFNHLLLEKHKTTPDISASDWYYVYSCKAWFYTNIIETIKSLLKGLPPNSTLIFNDLLSYHWSRPDGFLDSRSTALIGFLNAFQNYRRLL